MATSSDCLWLDYIDYTQSLFGGRVPWLDADVLVAWQRKADSLLAGEVMAVTVAGVAEQWLAATPQLSVAMSAKARPLFPLKTLVGDEAFRGHLGGLADALRRAFPRKILALVLPSPPAWTALAYAQVFPGLAVEIDGDTIESASVYIADFLRAFATTGIDAVLLEGATAARPLTDDVHAGYRPLLNVAGHYRWDLGVRTEGEPALAQANGPDFWIAPRPVPGMPVGVVVPPEFWSGGAAPDRPEGGFLFARIPGDAEPESVLERLASLR